MGYIRLDFLKYVTFMLDMYVVEQKGGSHRSERELLLFTSFLIF